MQVYLNQLKERIMSDNTLLQLEQLINQLIEQKNKLQQEVSDLKEKNSQLIDENETLQLEAIESDEKQKHAASTLENLLLKLQNAQQVN
ncbi:hypothetical protein PTUN_a0471 [Pseudoalteromonas tunicata]|uniref:Putative orphan protein n=2 Tax=Pseudoalteromonas tunicata TaxID=314281 RepID=A4C836_9GAMM|nr:hypothetical protein PTUN_a0471 [Pseudoalteromonas tunicata]EAR28751.1 putative orphan protein [Pseudoalteromonas tunicata D2]